jgi:hypothetical protein
MLVAVKQIMPQQEVILGGAIRLSARVRKRAAVFTAVGADGAASWMTAGRRLLASVDWCQTLASCTSAAGLRIAGMGWVT